MRIIEKNAAQCVGICVDCNLDFNKDYLGTYTIKYLREWVEKMALLNGDDAKVQVYRHASSAVNAKALVASEDGENPYVIITSLLDEPVSIASAPAEEIPKVPAKNLDAPPVKK